LHYVKRKGGRAITIVRSGEKGLGKTPAARNSESNPRHKRGAACGRAGPAEDGKNRVGRVLGDPGRKKKKNQVTY